MASYPYARLTPHINVGTMADAKLHALVSDLKAARRENPFDKPGIRTRIFAVASGRAARESLPSRRILPDNAVQHFRTTPTSTPN